MCMPCCRCVCHVVASLSCLFPLGLNRHPRPGAPRRWQRSRDLGLPSVTTAFKAGHINGGGLLLAGKSDTVCSRHYALDTCSNAVGEDLSDFDEDEHNALGNVDWKPEGWCREGREPAIDARVDVQECRMDELQDSDGERGCERSKQAGNCKWTSRRIKQTPCEQSRQLDWIQS